MIPTPAPGHDAPIATRAEDAFGAFKIAKAIYRAVTNAPNGWSTRIGLRGSWGTGKTSILNLLEELAQGDRNIVVRFSAWNATGEAGVISLFYQELAERLSREGIRPSWLTQWKSAVSTAASIAGPTAIAVGKAAENAAHLPGAVDAAVGVSRIAAQWLKIRDNDVRDLTAKLADRRVIVFIDDIDRADPQAIPKTFLALRELLDWPGFTFVIAFDEPIVASALRAYSEAYGENAHRFLEKVIDVPFDVPATTIPQRIQFAKKVFEACCPFFPTDTVDVISRFLPDEPRRIRLLGRKLGILRDVADRYDEGELDWYGIALYQVLSETSPRARTWFRAFFLDGSESLPRTLWLGNDAAQARAAFIETFRAALDDGLTDSLKTTLADIAVDLHERWSYIDKTLLTAYLDLTIYAPAITRKEVLTSYRLWNVESSSAPVIAALSAARKISEAPATEIAQTFLSLMVASYLDSFDASVSMQSDAERKRQVEKSQKQLSFLEFLWAQDDIVDVVDARRSTQCCDALISGFARWIAWDRNEGEKEIRLREATLALKCISLAEVPEDLYWKLDAAPGARVPSMVGQEQVARWRSDLGKQILPAVIDRLVGRFKIRGGVSQITDENRATFCWLLESDQSPLYTDEYSARLTGLFLEHPTDNEALHVIRENAQEFLEVLVGDPRPGGSWRDQRTLRSVASNAPALISAAWTAVMRQKVQFRMVSTLLEIRRRLCAGGLDAALFEEPAWLTQGARELDEYNAAHAATQPRWTGSPEPEA